MKRIPILLAVSTFTTLLLVTISNFIPTSSSQVEYGDVCNDCFTYSNAYGFPFRLREDESGGFAGLENETQYYTANYAKFGAAVFTITTLIQSPIVLRKRPGRTRA